jgi:amino acid transporter
MPRNAVKLIVIFAGVGFLVCFAFGISFYFRNLPTNPQPEIGRTYPLNNHGISLYLTKREETQQEVSFIIAGILGVMSFTISSVFDPFEQRKQRGPNERSPWNHRWGP